jgi:Modifier of rudimentary (Mod(r)) protein
VTSKTTADLAPVLSNPTLLSALATAQPVYADSLAPLSAALDTNLALATRVLALQNHVSSMREQTQQLLLQHSTLSTQWRRKQVEMDVALESWSPKALYGRLVSGIAEQEAVVRAIEESFLEESGGDSYRPDHGSGLATEREVADWIRRIRDGTAVLERRKESRARWDEGRVGGWR